MEDKEYQDLMRENQKMNDDNCLGDE